MVEKTTFTNDDANLFELDDKELKAKALRHSVLPRLRELTNAAIDEISRTFNCNIFEDSTECFSPQFRQKRDVELKINYFAVTAGISPKRSNNKWLALRKKSGQKPMIIAPLLRFVLTADGIVPSLDIFPSQHLDDTSRKKMVDWFCANNEKIERLLYLIRGRVWLNDWPDSLSPFSPPAELFAWAYGRKKGYMHFSGMWHTFPIDTALSIRLLIRDFTVLYPIYAGMVNLAKGTPTDIDEHMQKIQCYLQDSFKDYLRLQPTSKRDSKVIDHQQVVRLAEKKARVMPAIRWQVFQRDGWRCCSCGRGASEGAILEVDHIIPRSHGGKDSLENYQTLCRECNIGKSNRDMTNLRTHAAKRKSMGPALPNP